MAHNPLHPQNNKDHLCHDLDLANEQCCAHDYTSGDSDLTDGEKELMVKVLVEMRVKVKLKYDQRFKPLEQHYYKEMHNHALQLLGPDQPLTDEADRWIHVQARDRAVAKLEAEETDTRRNASHEWVEVSSDDEQDESDL
ncbi:hypothetical protein BT96DRAFT_1005379 [Gymnopus androsaceus JB14]|uniref:Uncharacterized protein n=1 Tax=Gymnopus androsaceus JB14 TaxID=1447944 RepID=A0A6A4GPB9_9AGAR|nr:hypothetical protein BT96DRAFT_1005379 [Gymnopus androsaceus JB14]